MTRRSGYVLAVVLATSVLPGGTAAGAASGDAVEPPLAAIVATGPTATSAVLAGGSWRVEIPFLHAGDTDPAVAPDGHRIAFVSERDGNEEIYVGDARSAEVRRLTHSSRSDRRPSWAPGGRRIVWQSGGTGSADLVVARADGRGRRTHRPRPWRRRRACVVS